MILYLAGFFILVIFYRIECIENDAMKILRIETLKHTVTECTINGNFTRIAKDRTKTQKSIRTLQLANSVKEILIK